MLGPIFARELVTVPRRRGHHAARCAVAGLLAILGITTWQATIGFSRDATLGETAAFGLLLFQIVAFVQLFDSILDLPNGCKTVAKQELCNVTFDAAEEAVDLDEHDLRAKRRDRPKCSVELLKRACASDDRSKSELCHPRLLRFARDRR